MLLVAALRGAYHLTELAGADLPHETRIERNVAAGRIDRLRRIPQFVRAYEPEAMKPADFIGYGVTPRTLSQFFESGWKLIEAIRDA